MLDEILVPSDTWPLAELNAMVADGDLVLWWGSYICWDFLETSSRRMEFLRTVFRSRGVPVGSAAEWVRSGGKLPEEIELQEPRRKPYCCTR